MHDAPLTSGCPAYGREVIATCSIVHSRPDEMGYLYRENDLRVIDWLTKGDAAETKELITAHSEDEVNSD